MLELIRKMVHPSSTTRYALLGVTSSLDPRQAPFTGESLTSLTRDLRRFHLTILTA
ncbi:hypothetical protein HPP92_018600 [Vanilla planifolia]|uniref:Uncharacterized protein n=1 Tax=Vanilla planifolia TaxID=51239 RepID=A0A835UNI3_VANPL|nr:hypothetical protein HPP92_018600 [Vanilla planifolia]